MFLFEEYTGLTTKDKTSEPNVRNSFCLFPYIFDSLKTCSFLWEIIKKAKKNTSFKAEDLI